VNYIYYTSPYCEVEISAESPAAPWPCGAPSCNGRRPMPAALSRAEGRKTGLQGRSRNSLNWDLLGTQHKAPVPGPLGMRDLSKLCLPSTPPFLPPERGGE